MDNNFNGQNPNNPGMTDFHGQQYYDMTHYNHEQQYNSMPDYNNGQQYNSMPGYNNGQQYNGMSNYNSDQQYMYDQYGYGAPKPQKKSKKGLVIGLVIGGLVVAIAVFLVLIFVFDIFGIKCKTTEELAEQVTIAFQTKDADLLTDLMGKEYRDYVIDEYDYKNVDEIRDDLADNLIDVFYEDMEEYYELGEVKSITIEEDSIEVDKYRGSDLYFMQEEFEKEMDCEISGYAEITLTWNVEGSKDSDEITFYLDAYHLDGAWYWFIMDYY